MKQLTRIILYIISPLLISGCNREEKEKMFYNDILIEVETPLTDGWDTEENIGTRSQVTEVIKQKGEDGLDMEANIQPDFTETPTGNVTTRWTNLDDDITFRVVAYKCATAAAITTTNYAGYGDYKLSGSTVQTIKSLTVPMGTYTFVCYSYGNSNAIAAFDNSSASVSAKNGQNFMTHVKANVKIDNIGSKYTLNDIAFKHQCIRYRVQVIAQNGRMGKITACSGKVTVPHNKATYNFNKDACTVQATTESVNVAWSNPNAMNVYSNYIYLLPQPTSMLTVSLNLTIGGKAFTNKSVTVSGPLTLSRNYMYCSNVSFTTTEGYIIGGALWANGNLVCTSGTYTNHSNTMYCSKAANAPDYFTFNNPLPNNPELITAWSDSRDPCRRVTPANTWRTPTLQDFTNLLQTGYNTEADHTTYGEVLKLPFGSFMRYTTGHPHEPYFDFIGYYLSTVYPKCLQNGGIGEYSEIEILAFPVRCIRSQ